MEQSGNDNASDVQMNSESIKIEESSGNFPSGSRKVVRRGGSRRGAPRRVKVFRRTLGRIPLRNQRNNNIRNDNQNQRQNLRPRRMRERRQRRGIRLIIRNLTKNVTNGELKEFFQRVGPLKRCGINYNEIGDTKGTADVQYIYENDAFKAFARFNNKMLGGVPIRIEILGQRRRNPLSSRRRRLGYRRGGFKNNGGFGRGLPRRRRLGRFENSFGGRRGGFG
ncbi:MAG: THO complex subunit 4, partial [archaeon]|nr:THO complex subunit 4 [archaeon]